jgi:molybdopterin synthase sulfur carrier subunit
MKLQSATSPRSARRWGRAAKRCTRAETLAALRDELIARGEPYASALARGKAVRMALDQAMSDEAAALREGCEVAFFPPVTGG